MVTLPSWTRRNTQGTGRTTANVDVSSVPWVDGTTTGFVPAMVPTFVIVENDCTLVGRCSNDTVDRNYPLKGGVQYALGFKKINQNADAGVIVVGKGE